jgi:hypothetical protein
LRESGEPEPCLGVVVGETHQHANAPYNVGSGFAAPPMTFEVNGKQYVAIASGPSRAAKARLVNTTELKQMRHATVLYVFGL